MDIIQAAQHSPDGSNSSSAPFALGEVIGWESWTSDLLENCCGRGSDQDYCNTALTAGIHRLHCELNTRRHYLGALKSASEFTPRKDQPWGWFPLIDTPILRVGLISLHRYYSIPLHDHPNAYGNQKVISGKVRVRQYQFPQDSDRHHTLVSLEKVSDSVLIKGESSIFTPSHRNLHELESSSSRCVLLSVMANPYNLQDRSWYYLIPFTQRENTGLYNRINKRPATWVGLDSMAR